MSEYENDLETMRNRLDFKDAEIRQLDDLIRLLHDDMGSLEIDYRIALDKIDHLELQLATAKDQLVLERNRSWQ